MQLHIPNIPLAYDAANNLVQMIKGTKDYD
jgi:hypothetical protein